MKVLLATHAVLGEVATVFLFLWIFVELLNPSEERIKRSIVVGIVAIVLIFSAWIVAGIYYVGYYGAAVKPTIKAGPLPWAHSIFTETKEHVFLFLPFLIILTVGMLGRYKNELSSNKEARQAVLRLSVLIILIGLAMVGMGFVIATGARAALEVA